MPMHSLPQIKTRADSHFEQHHFWKRRHGKTMVMEVLAAASYLRRALRPVISGSLISNNSARIGGGIIQAAYSELTIADSTISDNTASSESPDILPLLAVALR